MRCKQTVTKISSSVIFLIMISSSTLHVGRHGSTHSISQMAAQSAKSLQQHSSSSDSPQQVSRRRHHDTITEGGESQACSEDDKSLCVDIDVVKSLQEPHKTPPLPSPGQNKKGSNASHRDRR